MRARTHGARVRVPAPVGPRGPIRGGAGERPRPWFPQECRTVPRRNLMHICRSLRDGGRQIKRGAKGGEKTVGDGGRAVIHGSSSPN